MSNQCQFWECTLSAKHKVVADDKKEIELCHSHYLYIERVFQNRKDDLK